MMQDVVALVRKQKLTEVAQRWLHSTCVGMRRYRWTIYPREIIFVDRLEKESDIFNCQGKNK